MSRISRTGTTPLRVFNLGCLYNTPISAAHSLWWDHFEPAVTNQTEYVKQAQLIMDRGKAENLTTAADAVRSWTDKAVWVTEFIKSCGKLIVVMLVSSEDSPIGNKLFNAIRTGMMKK